MSRSKAVRSGLGTIFSEPRVFAIELVWRWTFWIAAWMLLAYALLMFLQSIPVSDRDYFGLIGPIPGTAKAALEHIFRGNAPKLLRISVALALGLGSLWWLAASTGRAATLDLLLPNARGRVVDVFKLHALRVAVTLTGALAYMGAYGAATISAYRPNRTPDMDKFFLVLLPLLLLVGGIWSTLNWYLSLAPIMAMRDGTSTLASLIESASASRRRSAQFAWVIFCFGVARAVTIVIGLVVLTFVMSLALQLPFAGAIALIAVWAALFSLGWCLIGTARLAAMVRVLQWQPD